MPDSSTFERSSSTAQSRVIDLVAEAIIAERNGQIASAKSLLSDAINLAPDWDEPLIRMAQCLRAEHRIGEARELYRKATSLPGCRIECLLSAGVLSI